MNTLEQFSRRGFLTFVTGLVGGTAGCMTPAPDRDRAALAARQIPKAPFRRVVTGFNDAGKSMVTHDGPVPLRAQSCCSADQIARAPHLQGISANEIWVFDSVPADLADTTDPLIGKLPDSSSNQPLRDGITARIVRYEPGVEYPMHTTSTVDLGIVISGSLQLLLEEGSTVVGPGEVVVQRGTPHGWRVVGDQPVLVLFVLVDAINGRVPRRAT